MAHFALGHIFSPERQLKCHEQFSSGEAQLKGIQKEDANYPQKVGNVQIPGGICKLPNGSLSILMQQKYFWASNLTSSGRSHVGSLFTSEEKKKAGS